jgi:hypothetical protein
MLSPPKRYSATHEQAMSEAWMQAWHRFEPNVAKIEPMAALLAALGTGRPRLSAE